MKFQNCKYITSFCLFGLALFLQLGCEHQPTKVVSEHSVMPEPSVHLSAEKIMALRPVILDVRSPFEFNLSHVPGSINVRWEDFSRQENQQHGLLQSDLFSIARRLSLIGIDPETPVLVLGLGHKGQGEEGRIAWTLQMLGVKDVYTLVHTSFRSMNPKEEAPAVKNKSLWKPDVQESLNLNLSQFSAVIGKSKVDYVIQGRKLSEWKNKIVILDVRSEAEFNLPNHHFPKTNSTPIVNIEWKKFFAENGKTSDHIEKVLNSKALSADHLFIVISNHGLRSAAVTYALKVRGYTKVTNFSGGYEQLSSLQ